MKSAVIYCRVSSEAQSEHGTSLETQLLACRAYAKEHGYVVLEEVSEDYTGARLDRPGMNRVRDAVAEGTVDALLVYALDRLARDTGDTLVVLKECKAHNCELVTVSQPYEDTPSGKLLLTMLAAIAEFERFQILDRTRRGRLHATRSGKVMGTAYTSYGYRYVTGEARLEVYEPEAEWVRAMYRWLTVDGMGTVAIARRLNVLGVPTRKGKTVWSVILVRRLLANPVYRGDYTWNKYDHRNKRKYRERAEWVTVAVPPIVSADVWHEAQAALARHSAHAARKTKRDYLLRGLLFCASCGYRLSGRAIHNTDKTRRYYSCDTKREKQRAHQGPCSVKYVNADRAEAAVWSEVERQLLTDEVIELWLSQRRDRTQVEGYERQLRILDERARKLRDERERLIDMYQSGDLARTEFSERVEGVKRRQAAADQERAEVEARIAHERATAPVAADWRAMSAQLRAALAEPLDFDLRRALLVGLNLRGVVDGRECTLYGLPEVVTLRL